MTQEPARKVSALCIFCEERFDGPGLDAKAAILAHVRICVQHPMRTVEQDSAQLRQALGDLLASIQSNEVKGAEFMAWIHGHRYSEAFLARAAEVRGRAIVLLAPPESQP